ncbi:3-hydroxyacyl-ACP dehydratase FabZ [Solimonas marina]|uniref:3-hydroxyacyl-[acyl-carrier-protein] dehydratase FabZ n=1 Tax=Solimonas marina TaxID=2714601 RepID=A0A970B5A4_9GAMM|nr:3-hydroxyacyl-ACP dehydratase FabZ [Solimonas marina]NKF23197.1 3-hydroxyacyl-ACP dehydratase FabZ [Solimonas marina]
MTKTFDIGEILKLLPHRYPFLLVDRVIAIDEEKMTLTAIKNVTINEPFFPGHFPGLPTMPGVLQIEALAQTCGLLAIHKSGLRAKDGLVLYFAGIDNCRFKRPVVPGDQLKFDVELEKHKRDIWKFKTRATVDGELASEADLICVLRKATYETDEGAQ